VKHVQSSNTISIGLIASKFETHGRWQTDLKHTLGGKPIWNTR